MLGSLLENRPVSVPNCLNSACRRPSTGFTNLGSLSIYVFRSLSIPRFSNIRLQSGISFCSAINCKISSPVPLALVYLLV